MLGRKVNGISIFFVINGQDIHDPNKIANEFCIYFIEHPKNIQNSILPPQNDYTDLIPFSGCTFVFNQSSPKDVYGAIKNLKKKGSKSMKYIKMCGMRLATILCDFFNMCFREQTYPDKFKCSRITPLYKKSVRTCVENHRPVASMCNLSKILTH